MREKPPEKPCKYCGCGSFYLKRKGTQLGLYCARCNKWLQWISKERGEYLRRSGVRDKTGFPEQKKVEEYKAPQCTCGCTQVEERQKGPHIGIYCTRCNKWLQWKGKKKQVSERKKPCELCKTGKLYQTQEKGGEASVKLEVIDGVLFIKEKKTGKLQGMRALKYCPDCGAKY